ncbi:MAG: outer membrane lipoprotein carrier protein LolA [Bacillaceae bacterium]
MKKRFGIVLVLLLSMLFVLTGCMEKTKEDVVADLGDKVKDLSGYKAHAKLMIKAGIEPQEYDVDVWYSKPDMYRVYLKNVKKDQSQIILRNKEGVFVLTPSLNKSFKFQSNWPKNSSQIYLYESLVNDIVGDTSATFVKKDGKYVFVTKTNYQNSNLLPKQEIVLTEDLKPVSVKLMDADKNTVFLVNFTKVKFDAKFAKNDFDVSKNMADAQKSEVPTATKPTEALEAQYPTKLPDGVTLQEEKVFVTDKGKRILLTYSGAKSFTLIQERAKASAVLTTTQEMGEPIDLGVAIGAKMESGVRWTVDDVDYMLISNDLTLEEVIECVQSMAGPTADK